MSIQAGDVTYLIGGDPKPLMATLDAVQKLFQDSYRDIAKQMEQAFGKSFSNLNDAKDKIDQTKKSSEGFVAAWKSASMEMVAFGGAFTGALGFMVKGASDWASEMSKIKTLGIENAADMKRIGDAAMSAGRTYGVDLKEAAASAYQAISLFGTSSDGISKALALMETSAKGAAGGYAQFDDVTGILIASMSAFEIQSKDMNKTLDTLVTGANLSQKDLVDFGSVVGNLAPAFASVGLSVNDMTAAMATATIKNQNMSEVGTNLINLVSKISNPTKESTKAFDELGIKYGQAAFEGQNLHQWLVNLQEKIGGNKDKLREMFPDQQAFIGAELLMGQMTEKLGQNMETLETKLGAVDEMLATVEQNDPSIQFRKMKNEVAILSVQIGNALLPAMLAIVQTVKPIVESMAAWANENPALLKTIVMIVGGLGSLSLAIGTLGMSLGPLLSAWELLSESFLGFPGLVAVLGNPITWIVAGLAAVGFAVYELYQNWDTVWAGMKDLFAASGQAIADSATWLGDALASSWDWIKTSFSSLYDTMANAFDNLVSWAKDRFEAFKDAVTAPISYVYEKLKAFGISIEDWFGHSTWIDAFKNLSSSADEEFGKFSTAIKTNTEEAEKALVGFKNFLDDTSFEKWAEQHKKTWSENMEDVVSNIKEQGYEIAYTLEDLQYYYLQHTAQVQSDIIMGFETTWLSFEDFVKSISHKTTAIYEDMSRVYQKIGNDTKEVTAQIAEDIATQWDAIQKQTQSGITGWRRIVFDGADDIEDAISRSVGNSIDDIKRLRDEMAKGNGLNTIGMAGHAAGGTTRNPIVKVGERGAELAIFPGYAAGGVVGGDGASTPDRAWATENLEEVARKVRDPYEVLNSTGGTLFMANQRVDYLKRYLLDLQEKIAKSIDDAKKQSETPLAIAQRQAEELAQQIQDLKLGDLARQYAETLAKEMKAAGDIKSETQKAFEAARDELQNYRDKKKLRALQEELAALQGVDLNMSDVQKQIDSTQAQINKTKADIEAAKVKAEQDAELRKYQVELAALKGIDLNKTDFQKTIDSIKAEIEKTKADIEVQSQRAVLSGLERELRIARAGGIDTEDYNWKVQQAQKDVAAAKVEYAAQQQLRKAQEELAALKGIDLNKSDTQKQIESTRNEIERTKIEAVAERQKQTLDALKRELQIIKDGGVDKASVEYQIEQTKNEIAIAQQQVILDNLRVSLAKALGEETDAALTPLQKIKKEIAELQKQLAAAKSLNMKSLLNGTSGGSAITGYAAGGTVRHPMAIVGEHGPELAALPVGTRIIPHGELMQSVRGYAAGGVINGLGFMGGKPVGGNANAYRFGIQRGMELIANRVRGWARYSEGMDYFSAQKLYKDIHDDFIKRPGWSGNLTEMLVKGFFDDEGLTLESVYKDKTLDGHKVRALIKSLRPGDFDAEGGSTSSGSASYQRILDSNAAALSGSSGGSSAWTPSGWGDMVDLGVSNIAGGKFKPRPMAAGGVIQALASGGMVKVGERGAELAVLPGMAGGSGGGSSNVSFNGPLVNVASVNASNQGEVDKFLAKVTSALESKLSGLGMNLNGVGRA